MQTYLSDFGLPKDFSKKKKLSLTLAKFVPVNSSQKSKTQTWSWEINTDLARVYLTIEDAVLAAIKAAAAEGYSEKEIKQGVVGILSMEYPAHIFNDFPVATAPDGTVIDAAFDQKTLSFNVTLAGRPYEDSSLNMMAVDSIVYDAEGVPLSFKARPVINSAVAT